MLNIVIACEAFSIVVCLVLLYLHEHVSAKAETSVRYKRLAVGYIPAAMVATAAVGWAHGTCSEVESLVKQAEAAMYEDKQALYAAFPELARK